MKTKTILILVDGMRSDSVEGTYADEFFKTGFGGIKSRTVMPSVTLPCHMSLFHSVTPERHGILTNTYVPQVRPIEGLVEALAKSGKKCAFFYNWEELRDLSRPGNLMCSTFISLHEKENTDCILTEKAVLAAPEADFIFLYLGETDEKGHASGWMSGEYLAAVNNAWNCIKYICEKLENEYNIVVTADHGGHGRGHGSSAEEDMNIPVWFHCDFPRKNNKPINITDIAPTIAALFQISPNRDWEGESLV